MNDRFLHDFAWIGYSAMAATLLLILTLLFLWRRGKSLQEP